MKEFNMPRDDEAQRYQEFKRKLDDLISEAFGVPEDFLKVNKKTEERKCQ